MIAPVLRVDYMKRSKVNIVVSLIIPLLSLMIVGMAFANGALGDDIEATWETFLVQVNMVLLFLVPLGITIIASQLVNIEHQSNGWKLLLAMPLKKEHVYLTKLIYVTLYSLLSSIILLIGIWSVGILLGLHEHDGVPWMLIVKQSFYPYIASFSIMSFQVFLSIFIKNQAFPIAIGVLTSIFTYSLMIFPTSVGNWLFWTYPTLASPLKPLFKDDAFHGVIKTTIGEFYLLLSLIVGFFITFIGTSIFVRKDTK